MIKEPWWDPSKGEILGFLQRDVIWRVSRYIRASKTLQKSHQFSQLDDCPAVCPDTRCSEPLRPRLVVLVASDRDPFGGN